jgi:hypothetical protein
MHVVFVERALADCQLVGFLVRPLVQFSYTVSWWGAWSGPWFRFLTLSGVQWHVARVAVV